MSDERKWCWASSRDSEEWFGPFASRDDALRDGERAVSKDGSCIEEFVISRCNYADPAEAAERWAESLEPLEGMHENTDDELQDYNDGDTYAYARAIFAVSDRNKLTDAIVAWAREHVHAAWFSADLDAMETVIIRSRGTLTE